MEMAASFGGFLFCGSDKETIGNRRKEKYNTDRKSAFEHSSYSTFKKNVGSKSVGSENEP